MTFRNADRFGSRSGHKLLVVHLSLVVQLSVFFLLASVGPFLVKSRFFLHVLPFVV
jgi:hypothetical protein